MYMWYLLKKKKKKKLATTKAAHQPGFAVWSWSFSFWNRGTRGQPNIIPVAIRPQPVRMLPNASSQDAGHACGSASQGVSSWAKLEGAFAIARFNIIWALCEAELVS